jgi:tetratricopeptide (TPR) repeat protein
VFLYALRPSHLARCLSTFQLVLCATLVITFSATRTPAQLSGTVDSDVNNAGTGGAHSIQGRIYYPGGRLADKRFRVRLRGARGGEQFTISDDNGSFTLTRLRAGAYDLTIDAGDQFEPVEQRVDVFNSGAGRSQVVALQINLELKRTVPKPVGTVDAASAGVPEAALNLYKKAIESDREGNRAKAIEQLKEALVIHPGFLLALNELGLQYLRDKQPEKAAACLRPALDIAPESFAPRLNLGIALLHMKEFKAASIELRRALSMQGNSAPAHMHLGRAHIGLEDYRAAEKELQRAIGLGGDDVVEAHRFLGAAYIELHEEARAADALGNYLRLAPKTNDAARIREIIERLRRQATTGQR